MGNLRTAVPDELLKRCEQEPIHIPGAIQPHGALLVVDRQNGRILQVSSNIRDYLDLAADELLGRSLGESIDGGNCASLFGQIPDAGPSGVSRRVPVRLPGTLAAFDVEAHRVGEHLIVLELQRAQGSQEIQDHLASELEQNCLLQQVFSIADDANREEGVFEVIAEKVREITGYDRTMVYQFDPNGHGWVRSESKREDLPSYEGLHYPSSDIPQRARSLYLSNRIRQLTDVHYEPTPILPEINPRTGQPLDMSMCHLRSVSPVHLEYLDNMGVRATLVISVVSDGKLWGLIACHHYSPKSLSISQRYRCDSLAHLLSLIVQAQERRQWQQATESSHAHFQRLEREIQGSSNWKQELFQSPSLVLEPLNAGGALLYHDGEIETCGQLPPDRELRLLIDKLEAHRRAKLFACDSLSERFPELRSIEAVASGCLSVTISEDPPCYLMWLRPEVARTVTWAGNPRKGVIEDEQGIRLSPRKSFAKWQEEVKGRSLPWTLLDELIANSISLFVSMRKVEDANRLKTQFLANMSHEIRTPMTAILGFAGILDQQISYENEVAQDAVSTITRNGKHLLAIIDGILDLAKIESGKILVDDVIASPAELVEGVRDLMLPVAMAKGLKLRLETKGNLPQWIRTDSTRLRQVLINLVNNAIKFTESGEVVLRTETFAVASSDERRLLMSVSDTGPGLKPNEISRLFRPFVQANESMTRRHGGVGLGLSICKQLVEKMGGDIRAESRFGSGTTFRVDLPLKLASVDGGPEESRDKANGKYVHRLSRLKVLLAEDGIDNQRLISALLRKRLGADVTVAENGAEAVRLVEHAGLEDGFDLILMDIQMPEMDGYAATRNLREAGCSIPIVALTAHAMSHDRQRCFESGCDGYLSKPIDWDRLQAEIAAQVNARRTKPSPPLNLTDDIAFGSEPSQPEAS